MGVSSGTGLLNPIGRVFGVPTALKTLKKFWVEIVVDAINPVFEIVHRHFAFSEIAHLATRGNVSRYVSFCRVESVYSIESEFGARGAVNLGWNYAAIDAVSLE
jgi:hypothetical protein